MSFSKLEIEPSGSAKRAQALRLFYPVLLLGLLLVKSSVVLAQTSADILLTKTADPSIEVSGGTVTTVTATVQ